MLAACFVFKSERDGILQKQLLIFQHKLTEKCTGLDAQAGSMIG
jgi:hypothetical protein